MARLGTAFVKAAGEHLPIAREALRAAREDLELAEQGRTREPVDGKLSLVNHRGELYVVDEDRYESVRYGMWLLATGSENTRPEARLPYRG